jgi:hypothetical protein
MTFRMEITRTWYYVESDDVQSWATDPHRTELSEMEYDADIREDYDTPVEWAVGMLNNDRVVATPNMAGFPDLSPSCWPVARPHEWLSGTTGDNYTNEESEWSIRLTSPEWTPEMRADVFRRATERN